MSEPGNSIFSRHYPLAATLAAVWLLLLNTVSPVLSQTWTPTGLPSTEYIRVACSSDGATLLAGPWNGPIYTSTNSGTTWLELSPPVPPGSFWEQLGISSWHGLACSADGSTILGAAANGGLCVSTNLGQSWSETLSSDVFQGAACSADGKRMLAVADNSLMGGSSGIYLSSDGGITWTQANLPSFMWFSAASSADGRILAAGGPNIYISTNWGETWSPAGLPDSNYGVACSADGARMIASSFAPGGLFVSSDAGTTWTSAAPTNADFFGVACSADGKKLAAAASGGPIYRSTDSGASWSAMDAPLTNWCALAGSADGNTLVAASMNGSSDYLGLVYTCHFTPAPELKLTAVDQNFVLSWILPSRRCVLEQSSDLSAPGWIDITNVPVLDCTTLRNQVTLPRMSGSRFYRLRVE